MGQKINPIGLRLGVNRTWDSRWYADTGDYGNLLHEDLKIRKYVMDELKQAAIAKVVIERPHKKCRVTIHSARPGLIIGKKGADIEKLRRKLADLTNVDTSLNIVEVRKPEVDCSIDCSAVGTSCSIPSCDEESCSICNASWCRRYSYQLRRSSWWC